MRIIERSNPAAVGWRAQRNGTEWEIAWLRGTTALIATFRRDDRTWSPPIGMDRDRWSHAGTLASARAKAHEFLTGKE